MAADDGMFFIQHERDLNAEGLHAAGYHLHRSFIVARVVLVGVDARKRNMNDFHAAIIKRTHAAKNGACVG